MTRKRVTRMIPAVTKIVGEDRVTSKSEILEDYSGLNSPALVVWPKSTDEVAKIVEWANSNSVALVPVSSGGPRRRGSSTPKVDNAVIVDLSRMNKIIRVDTKNKVAMFEPGVTFEQLIPELKKKGLRPLMPLLPKASKSVLASCLDREPTTIPRFHWDISDPLLCTETVFGSGETLRTGSAAGPGTIEEQWASGQAQKNPQGPSQFDPFRIIQGSQGTIGITTWISMKCELLPDVHEIYLTGVEELGQLEAFNYALLKRRLVDEHFLLNSVSLSAALGSKRKTPNWVLVLGVSGHGILAQEELEYRTEDTMDIAEEMNLKLTRSLGDIKADEVKSLLNRSSSASYWKYSPRGSCSEVFFTTTLDQVAEMHSVFLEVADEVGVPKEQIGVYVQPVVQGVNTHCAFDIHYDPDSGEEVESVSALLDKGQHRLLDEGAFFSRPHGIITDLVFEKTTPEMVEAIQSVKKIFDPKNVLNPGTLCFKEVPK
ncbi:MAG: FAD-binding oxidoreductase [Candidatus Hermodarchaeota archaeon]